MIGTREVEGQRLRQVHTHNNKLMSKHLMSRKKKKEEKNRRESERDRARERG